MKLWLDDERPAPAGWVRCYWPREVIRHLVVGGVSVVSLDHDLGDDSRGTGYDVLLWVEAQAAQGYQPPEIRIHTANPAARQRMEAARRKIAQIAGTASASATGVDPDGFAAMDGR